MSTTAPEQEMSTARRVWWLFVLCFALSLVIASLTGLYPAAADLVADTGASQTELTWIVDAYTLAMAGLLLPAGALGDRFGRRGIMNVGLGLFALGSVIPLVMDDPTVLIVARGFTGLAAACIMPSTLSLITSVFPPQHRDQAVAVWAAVATLAGAFGILGSGALLEFFGWRSVFWLFLIMAVIGFALAWTVPSSREDDPPPLDCWGAVTSATSISAVVYGLIEAGHRGWSSPIVLVAIATGLVTGAAFVIIQLRRTAPLLDVRLFRIRPFAAGAVAITMVFVTTFGMFFVTMQYMQFVLGYSALHAGLIITVMGLTIIPLSAVAAWLTAKRGLRVMISAGCLCAMVTCLILYRADTDSGFVLLATAMLVFGGGIGFTVAPCTSAIIDNVSAEKQGVASAVNHTTREVGAALGIALLGSILSSGYSERIHDVTQPLPEPTREISRESIAAALQVAAQSGPGGPALSEAARDAFVHGFQNAMLVTALLMAASAVLTYLWAPGPTRKGPLPRTEPVTATLPHGDEIRGSVRCGTDTLAGVPVVLLNAQGHQVARVRSDEDGRFRLTGASNEGLLVCVAPGFRPAICLIDSTSTDSFLDVNLDAHGVVEGTARIGGGENQSIVVSVIDESGTVKATSVTAADGRYRLEGLPAGSYILAATCAQARPVAVDVSVPVQGSARVDLDLPRLHEVTGRIQRPRAGDPVRNGAVVLTDRREQVVTTITTDAQGHFTGRHIPAGRYTLEITDSRYAEVPVVVEARGSEDTTVDLYVPLGYWPVAHYDADFETAAEVNDPSTVGSRHAEPSERRVQLLHSGNSAPPATRTPNPLFWSHPCHGEHR